MRNQTLVEVSPRTGTVNDPLADPVVAGRCGWVCVSWWKSTDHVNAPAPRAPSSASVPVPENETVCPPLYIVPLAGVSMTAWGRRLLVTVRTASLLVAV